MDQINLFEDYLDLIGTCKEKKKYKMMYTWTDDECNSLNHLGMKQFYMN